MNYQNRGLCYLPKPKAEADNTDLGFDNSRYHAKTDFSNCFIIHFWLKKFDSTTRTRVLGNKADFELDMITQYLLQILGYHVKLTCYCIFNKLTSVFYASDHELRHNIVKVAVDPRGATATDNSSTRNKFLRQIF